MHLWPDPKLIFWKMATSGVSTGINLWRKAPIGGAYVISVLLPLIRLATFIYFPCPHWSNRLFVCRGYYRCWNKNCDVKKTVQRDAQDKGIVITTYLGKHNHETPTIICYNIGNPEIVQNYCYNIGNPEMVQASVAMPN